MPLREGYLPRKGDIVLVQARVKNVDDNDAECYLEVVGKEYHNFFMSLTEINALYCRKWNDGDLVRSIEFEGRGRVVAVSEDWVWVIAETGDDEGTYHTLPANDIEPYVKPEELTVEEADHNPAEWNPMDDESLKPPLGSQSAVGDDEEIKF